MTKILGLDLGTNSIGWAVVEYDRNHVKQDGNRKVLEEFILEDKGVYIFTEGVDKDSYGNPQSRAANRTDRRSARRLKFRRKLRKYETLKALIKHKMCPLQIEELKKWRQFENPLTKKKETFRYYPTNPAFIEWLQTDNQGQRGNDADKLLRKKKIKNPYYYRDKASREKLTNPYELGRAFYHLAQRRGFLSNRLDKSDKSIVEKAKPDILNRISEIENYTDLKNELIAFFEVWIVDENTKEENRTLINIQKKFEKEFKEKQYNFVECKAYIEEYLNKPANLGPVLQRISDLTKNLEEENCKTIGQMFYKWLCVEKWADGKKKIRGKNTAREEHYEQEFKEICRVQGITENSEVYRDIYNGIFYQRELKSQKSLVGKCILEPKYPRCPVSHPAFEEFRALKFINNIKINDGERWRQLLDNEKKTIWEKFFRKSKEHFDFKELAKAIKPDYPWDGKSDKEPDEKKKFFNYKGNTTVTGCPTIANMMDLFGKDWKEPNWESRLWNSILDNPMWKTNLYDECRKKEIRSRKTKQIIGKKEISIVVNDVWHALFTFGKEKNLKNFAQNYFGADEKIAAKFSQIQLKQEYASFSLKAINNIIPRLREGLIESYAIFLAKIPELIPEVWNNKEYQELIRKELWNIIDNYKENKRKQVIVNELIKKFKDEYGNNDSNYTLDKKDKENVIEKLHDSYGEKTWNAKPEKEISALIHEITSILEKQLRNNKFLEIKRLDEEIKDFFITHPDLCIDNRLSVKLYHPSDIEKFKDPISKQDTDDIVREYPNSPISGSIKNPTVFRALFQLRKVLNELIRKDIIDRNTRINIELTRSLNDMNYRWAIEKWQKEREKENEEYKQIIIGLFKTEKNIDIQDPEDDDLKRIRGWHEQYSLVSDMKLFELLPKDEKDPVKKYRLWKEQKGICIYTGKSIPLHKLFDGTSFDIEHTIPKSKSNNNSLVNLTICDATYNRQNKKGRIPYQLGEEKLKEVLSRIESWKIKYTELDKQINKLKKVAAATKQDKEKHDKIIRQKHLLTLEYDYWFDKYNRFIIEEIPSSFTNRHLVDTGIITRYALQWLRKYFSDAPVYAINGEITSDFRKIWGLQPQYQKKERTNHIHHCIDAITIACITKDKYDLLAQAYKIEEEGKVEEARSILIESKPWKSFTKDILDIENEVAVTHQFLDNVPKQTRKNVRIQGKKQYVVEYPKDTQGNILRDKANKKIVKRTTEGAIVYKLNNGRKIPKIQRGDTVRGPLHRETFYGAIKIAERDLNNKFKKDAENNIIFEKDKDGKEIFYVLRKELEKLKKEDVEKIVDTEIKKIIQQAFKDKILAFNKTGAVIKEGATIWQNSEKKIPIKKVRVFANITNPLPDFKKHRDLSKPSHKHKEQYYVDNQENYCMAIYEGKNNKGKIKRAYELINMKDAGEYYRLSNEKHRKQYPLYPEKHQELGYPLKVILKKEQMILRRKENETIDEILKLSFKEQLDRLFIITGLDKDGIKCYYHNEARSTTDALKHMNDVINEQNQTNNITNEDGSYKESKLTSGKSSVEIGQHKDFPFIKFQAGNFNAFIEGIDFKITPIGKISKA